MILANGFKTISYIQFYNQLYKQMVVENLASICNSPFNLYLESDEYIINLLLASLFDLNLNKIMWMISNFNLMIQLNNQNQFIITLVRLVMDLLKIIVQMQKKFQQTLFQ
ncbi:unnamed protein product [Paramecium pentaurelia]|uniref:Uncharacterized protein n=1 Tax=Paramecium pentaurelia TaxID=43138 RepID=A0A8S1VYC5_9CILI|nr:unnamed protein product [Paramecium pentaurelia]